MYLIRLNQRKLGATVLHGAGVGAPFKGAKYSQKAGPGDTVDETLELLLENTNAGTIAAGYTALEKYLTASKEYADQNRDRPAYLEAQLLATEGVWRSEILAGWVEVAGGSRGAGSVGLLLHVTRRNYWEAEESQLYLTDVPHGRSLTPMTVFNHDDAGANHDNFCRLSGADVPGDLPAPVKVKLLNGTGSTLTRLYLTIDNQVRDNWFQTFYEAEAAAGGSLQNNAGCSGGQYKAVSWNDTAEAEVLTWAITQADMCQAVGRFYKALLRLQAGTAYTNLWARLKLKISTTIIWEGPWVLVPASVELFELNTLQMPPYLLEVDSYDALNLTLCVKRATAGAHSLPVDFIELLPLDGYHKLAARNYGLPNTDTLTDDSGLGVAYIGLTYAKTDWLCYGGPLFVQPGCNAKIYAAFMAAGAAAVDWYVSLSAFIRARKRNL